MFVHDDYSVIQWNACEVILRASLKMTFMSSYSEMAYAEKKHECHAYMSVFHFDYLYSPTFDLFIQNLLHSVKFRIML